MTRTTAVQLIIGLICTLFTGGSVFAGQIKHEGVLGTNDTNNCEGKVCTWVTYKVSGIDPDPTTHFVSADFTVPDEMTLLIDPGAKIIVADGTSITIKEGATLRACPEKGEERITIRAIGKGWKGITIEAAQGLSCLGNVTINGTEGPALLLKNDGALQSQFTLSGLQISDTQGTAISVNGRFKLVTSQISNSAGGITALGGQLVVEDSTFLDITGNAITTIDTQVYIRRNLIARFGDPVEKRYAVLINNTVKSDNEVSNNVVHSPLNDNTHGILVGSTTSVVVSFNTVVGNGKGANGISSASETSWLIANIATGWIQAGIHHTHEKWAFNVSSGNGKETLICNYRGSLLCLKQLPANNLSPTTINFIDASTQDYHLLDNDFIDGIARAELTKLSPFPPATDHQLYPRGEESNKTFTPGAYENPVIAEVLDGPAKPGQVKLRLKHKNINLALGTGITMEIALGDTNESDAEISNLQLAKNSDSPTDTIDLQFSLGANAVPGQRHLRIVAKLAETDKTLTWLVKDAFEVVNENYVPPTPDVETPADGTSTDAEQPDAGETVTPDSVGMDVVGPDTIDPTSDVVIDDAVNPVTPDTGLSNPDGIAVSKDASADDAKTQGDTSTKSSSGGGCALSGAERPMVPRGWLVFLLASVAVVWRRSRGSV